MRRALAMLAAALLVGCSAKPVLYPNAHLADVGPEIAEADVARCMELADAYVESSRSADTAARTAEESAVGAATGGAAGAVFGRAGRGAAAGAAGGAARGLVRSLFRNRQPDPVEKRFTERCLADLGYQTIGWK